MKTVLTYGTLLAFGHALSRPHYRNRIDAEPFIVGGIPAKQGELPYQLALLQDDRQHCGASLIEVQGILVGLTAAHCKLSENVESYTLVGGDASFSDSTGLEQRRNVTKFKIHDQYRVSSIITPTPVHDIALLFINQPFEINENVRPIRLPEAGQQTAGELKVSGWGMVRRFEPPSDILRKVVVPVVDDKTCQDAYRDQNKDIYVRFLCAGYLGVGGKDICDGDSGGPAVSIDGGYLAGVVSGGIGCAHPNYPGIHTEVSYYIDWINKSVAKHIEEIKMK